MQHSMVDGPGLHFSYAGCSRIGIDGDQVYPTGCGGPQPDFSVIHNLSSQWTEGLTACIDESQNYLVAAQRRQGDRVTELICEGEVRCEIARHWKAANWIVRRVSRLRGRLVARHCEKPDTQDSRGNYDKC